jgi:hypothetical protein
MASAAKSSVGASAASAPSPALDDDSSGDESDDPNSIANLSKSSGSAAAHAADSKSAAFVASLLADQKAEVTAFKQKCVLFQERIAKSPFIQPSMVISKVPG